MWLHWFLRGFGFAYYRCVEFYFKRIYSAIEFKNLKEAKLYYIYTQLSNNKTSLELYKERFGTNLLDDFEI